MDKNKRVLTVVSPGGHLTQALCIMEAVSEFYLVTSKSTVVSAKAKEVIVIKGTQYNPLRHLLNLFTAYKIIKKVKPDAVFSTGGPICISFAIVCKLTGMKFIYLDTLSRVIELSNTASFLVKFGLATKVMSQWKNVANQYEQVSYYGKTFDICNDRNEPIQLSSNA